MSLDTAYILKGPRKIYGLFGEECIIPPRKFAVVEDRAPVCKRFENGIYKILPGLFDTAEEAGRALDARNYFVNTNP